MGDLKDYPREVFSYREDVTRENMRKYDAWLDRVWKRKHEIAPNYSELSFKERLEITRKAREEIGGWQ